MKIHMTHKDCGSSKKMQNYFFEVNVKGLRCQRQRVMSYIMGPCPSVIFYYFMNIFWLDFSNEMMCQIALK